MSDLISRQDTIDRINEYIEEYSEIDSDGNHSEKWCAMQEAKMTIENMPSAQETHEERTETHACDLIDRQAAIALAKDIIVPIKDGTVYKYRCIDPDSIKELPSECNVIYCRDCRFYIGHRCQATRGLDDWRNQDDYCSRAERIDQ